MADDGLVTHEVTRIPIGRNSSAGAPRRSKDAPTRRIVSFNPFRCRVWALHDRLAEHITEESCRTEIASFTSQGQLIPVLGRLVCGDPEHDVELIYGARRLFVARHLNMPLQVELRDLSDREALSAMDIENRHRKDVSAYERGTSYARWLRASYFSSQEDIARALRISPAQVSRLLKLAQLPSVVVSAFESPRAIQEGWGLDLFRAWQCAQIRPLIAQRARAICERSPRPPGREVYRQLIAARSARRTRGHQRDEVVTGNSGAPLFRIRFHRKAVALLVPTEKMSARTLERIRFGLRDILQSESQQ